MNYYLSIVVFDGENNIILKIFSSQTPYNADKIVSKSVETLNIFDIWPEKIKYLSIDNAKVMIKVHRDLQEKLSIAIILSRCICHKLNLVIKRIIQ